MVPERAPDLRWSPEPAGSATLRGPGLARGSRAGGRVRGCGPAGGIVLRVSQLSQGGGERGHPRGGRLARVQSCSGGPASLGAALRARLGFTVMSSKQPCSAAPVQACRPWRGHSGFIHKCRIPCPSLGVCHHGHGQRGGPVPQSSGMDGGREPAHR